MEMEKYISDLMYRYDCVIVPDFGAFLANPVSAKLIRDPYTFLPPSKNLSFNQLLTNNDGLLATYISDVEKCGYEKAMGKIKDKTALWNQILNAKGKIVLDEIGTMVLNLEGKIVFEPKHQTNYLTSSFGLSPVVATPIVREVLKEQVVAMEEKIPFVITPEQRERSKGLRPYLKYAAVGLLALATGFTVFQLINRQQLKQQLVDQQVEERVSKTIQEATFFSTNPLEMEPLNLNIGSSDSKNSGSVHEEEAVDVLSEEKFIGRHKIVAGAFRYEANALKKVSQLKSKGYNAFYLGTNKFGLHQVCYDSFDNANAALSFLYQVKKEDSSDAWMLSQN